MTGAYFALIILPIIIIGLSVAVYHTSKEKDGNNAGL